MQPVYWTFKNTLVDMVECPTGGVIAKWFIDKWQVDENNIPINDETYRKLEICHYDIEEDSIPIFVEQMKAKWRE